MATKYDPILGKLRTDDTTDTSGLTPTTRTVNGHPLSANVTVTATDLSLGNVNNTSDANKPVSTATQTALDLKAPLASPTFSGTVGGVTKSMVGLGSVDNTSDAGKPVSTAQQTALDLKVVANTAITGATKIKTTYDSKGLITAGVDATTADIADSADKRYVTDAQRTVVGNTSGTNTGDQTAIANATLANMATKTYKGRTSALTGSPEDVAVATLKTDLGLVKADVGLGSVVNSDTTTTANITDSSNKRFITDAQQTVLGNTSGTNTGDQILPTDATLVTTDVATNNVSTTKHGFAPKITDVTKYLKGDGTWSTPTAAAPDISTSMLAPTTDETIAASLSAVSVRSYKIASGKKLTLGLASRFRIL